MSDDKFLSIMFVIVQSLCNKIKDYYNIKYDEARKLLYTSKIYKAIEDEQTKMWYFSTTQLFEMFKEEKETGKYTVSGY